MQKIALGCAYGQPDGDGHVLGPHSIDQNSGVKPRLECGGFWEMSVSLLLSRRNNPV